MPFTPFHVGPGIAVKAALDKKFSLLVFAWSQIVMDLQPLVVILTHRGELHGITHTLIGAAFLGVLAAVSGKYLSEWLVNLLSFGERPRVVLRWPIVFLSAMLGTFSHVLIDALVYPDIRLFWPFSSDNPLKIGVSSYEMIVFCVTSGVLGAVLWGVMAFVRNLTKRDNGK